VVLAALVAVIPTLTLSGASTATGEPTSTDGLPTSSDGLPTSSALPATTEPNTTLPPPLFTTAPPTTAAPKPSTTTRATVRTTATTRRSSTTTTTSAAPLPGVGPPTPAAQKLLGPGGGKVAGSGITPPGMKADDVLADLPDMRAHGLNTASVDVFWVADAVNANSVHPGPMTPSDAELERIITTARRAGMRVSLTPKVTCPTCKRTAWRGILTPKDKAKFFDSYGQMIDRYAALAQRNQVWLFFIGSEFNRIQDQANRWRAIASRARQSFSGPIAYEVNWDVWNQVTFWDAVDVVGVSAYFPLSESMHPSVRELMIGWRSSTASKFKAQTWLADLRQLARDTGRPILFGELGYPAYTHTAREPFEPHPKNETPYDEGQAAAFQAALATFEPESWWVGAMWWEWIDTSSYTFRNKPAAAVLQRWYVDGVRPQGEAPINLDPPPKPYTPPPLAAGVSGKFRVLSAFAMLLALLAWSGWLFVTTALVQERKRVRRRLLAGAARYQAAMDVAAGGSTPGEPRHSPTR
jgi:hypothetical protein